MILRKSPECEDDGSQAYAGDPQKAGVIDAAADDHGGHVRHEEGRPRVHEDPHPHGDGQKNHADTDQHERGDVEPAPIDDVKGRRDEDQERSEVAERVEQGGRNLSFQDLDQSQNRQAERDKVKLRIGQIEIAPEEKERDVRDLGFVDSPRVR